MNVKRMFNLECVIFGIHGGRRPVGQDFFRKWGTDLSKLPKVWYNGIVK